MTRAPQPRAASSVRLFRALLALYPAAFRDEYGREMSLVFADRYRDASTTWDRVRLWAEALAGVVIEAPKEHGRLALQDLHDALRRLRTSPGFGIIAVVTLALAIAASTTMFSVLNAVVLRPLPYPAAHELAMLWTEQPRQGLREGRTAFGTVEHWRRQSESFADLAVMDPVSVMVGTGADSDQVTVLRASPDLFSVLGIQPAQGRVFSGREADERRRLAVISHRFWQARFGGTNALGASIVLDGRPSEIIGILPDADLPGFTADVWEPHTLFADWDTRRTALGAGSWFVIGRLHSSVTVEHAQAEMHTIARRLDGELPSPEQGRGVSVVPLHLQITAPRSRLTLWMLTGAALCLLLVAAANIGGLSLARSTGRIPELAIRTALGASRTRIVRQLLAESLTVAAVAGLFGLLLAWVGIRVVQSVGPGNLARMNSVGVDWRVVLWAMAASLLAGLVVGLGPGLTVWRRDLRIAGAEAGRGITGSAAARRVRRSLVVLQCAVALVLLVVAGLLLRSWWNVLHVDPGFDPDRVVTMNLTTAAAMPPQERAPFYDRLIERLQAVPGVELVGVSSELLVSSVGEQALRRMDGDPLPVERFRFRRDEVSAGFFRALGTPLIHGRFFSADDRPDAPRVVIINEAMAQSVWPGRDAVGRRFALGFPPTEFTVVGVVKNMRRQGLETEPVAQMFESLSQNPPRRAILSVRAASADAAALVGALRESVRQTDPGAVVYRVATLDDRLGAFVAQRRFQTALLTGFSLVALLLATIGLYSLIQYSVAMRTHEIGLRMALGAGATDIFRMIVREGLTLGALGLVLGCAAAFWISQAGANLLFGVAPTDPLTFVGVSLLLLGVTVFACLLPARRAMAVPPVIALHRR